MDTPTQEQIAMFMSITGASETVALQKLEQNRGDLNEAVNSYFNEGDRSSLSNTGTGTGSYRPRVPARDRDEMEIDDPTEFPFLPSTLLSSHGNMNPFSLLNPADFLNPRVSQPRVSREIPIEVKDGNTPIGPSNTGPTIEEVTDLDEGPHLESEVHPTVIIDEADDDLNGNNNNNSSSSSSSNNNVGPAPSAPLMDYNNEIEEQMILAAIEASKQDAEGAFNLAEEERVLRARGIPLGENVSDFPVRELLTDKRSGTQKAGTSSTINEGNQSDQEEETEDVEEVPLVRHRYPTRQSALRSVQPVNYQDPEEDEIEDRDENIPASTHGPSDEWGGLSNLEHDEAVMLEAAMFGGIPEGGAYRFTYPHIGSGSGSNNNVSGYPRLPVRTPSPGLTEQRLLREQQDDEYLAALQADQEKEMKAIQEREAEIQRKILEEEESKRKQLEEEEMERKLLAKEASLPEEPSQDDENAITLLVRLPDGTRRGRRFLKSDKLQFLFDFIDVARIVKPNSFRLVRPYPRRAFTHGEAELSLNELGLTSKQEALFLETI